MRNRLQTYDFEDKGTVLSKLIKRNHFIKMLMLILSHYFSHFHN